MLDLQDVTFPLIHSDLNLMMQILIATHFVKVIIGTDKSDAILRTGIFIRGKIRNLISYWAKTSIIAKGMKFVRFKRKELACISEMAKSMLIE